MTTLTRRDATAAAATALDEVGGLLSQTVRRLADDWVAITGGTTADVLGGCDVPRLLELATRGGKRFRPLMVHWGWVAAGGHSEKQRRDVVRVGAALELLHVFALVHDDVMDRSELRRGHPTVHALARDAHHAAQAAGDAQQFGNSIAILVGDLAHAEADHLVAGLSPEVHALWRRLLIELVLGQRRDLTGAAMGRRDLDHALQVARLKTGTYTVERPLEIGARIAGADAKRLAALAAYGRHVGSAFGLRDDVLGTWGDPDRTGKPNDDDLTAGKATVLLALASHVLPPAARRLLVRVGTEQLTTTDLARLRLAMADCGVREKVEEMIRDEVDAACRAIEGGGLSDEGVAGLTELAHLAAWRQA